MKTSLSPAASSLFRTVVAAAEREIANGRVIATTGFYRAAVNPFLELSSEERRELRELDRRFWSEKDGPPSGPSGVTDLEADILSAIIQSEYQSDDEGREPVPTWSVTYKDHARAGALGSLVKKGLVAAGGKDEDMVCSITDAGVAARSGVRDSAEREKAEGDGIPKGARFRSTETVADGLRGAEEAYELQIALKKAFETPDGSPSRVGFGVASDDPRLISWKVTARGWSWKPGEYETTLRRRALRRAELAKAWDIAKNWKRARDLRRSVAIREEIIDRAAQNVADTLLENGGLPDTVDTVEALIWSNVDSEWDAIPDRVALTRISRDDLFESVAGRIAGVEERVFRARPGRVEAEAGPGEFEPGGRAYFSLELDSKRSMDGDDSIYVDPGEAQVRVTLWDRVRKDGKPVDVAPSRLFHADPRGGLEARMWIADRGGAEALVFSSSFDYPDEEGSTEERVRSFLGALQSDVLPETARREQALRDLLAGAIGRLLELGDADIAFRALPVLEESARANGDLTTFEIEATEDGARLVLGLGAPSSSAGKRDRQDAIRRWFRYAETARDECCEHGHFECATTDRGPCENELFAAAWKAAEELGEEPERSEDLARIAEELGRHDDEPEALRCERCGTAGAEEVPGHGMTLTLCESCARRELPNLFSDRKGGAM